MKFKFLAICLVATSLIFSLECLSQSDSSKKTLPEVVIFANKFPALSKNIIQKVDFITDKNTINQQAC